MDGLCGPYAIVNMLKVLYPDRNEQFYTTVFQNCIRSLTPKMPDIFWEGTTIDDLIVLLGVANHTLKGMSELPIKWSLLKKQATLEDVFASFKDGKVAFLSVMHPFQHWTVATSVTSKNVIVVDSDGIVSIKRKRIVPYQGTIDEENTFIDMKEMVVVEVDRPKSRSQAKSSVAKKARNSR